MPKLWDETIAAHRLTVRDTIVDATAALIADHGLTAVTMSQIAEASGVGRATLYRYFPDVESIVAAWHERHVSRHLARLRGVRDAQADPRERLEAVLEAYARISVERSSHDGPHRHERTHRHDPDRARQAGEVAAHLHRREHIEGAEDQLREFLRQVVKDAQRAGATRDDVPADELARFCLRALAAAGDLRTEKSVARLVAVTLSGLRPEPRLDRARRRR